MTTRVKVHEYLGMMLDLKNKVELRVTMVDYLKGVLEDFPGDITGRSAIPVANHTFQVGSEDKQTLLDEEWETVFCHTMAQLIFFTSRSRKEINTAIDLLCTQVRSLYEYYWGKIVGFLKYIRGTLHLLLILRADSLVVIKCWVDAFFAINLDCKGHTGDMISMVSGYIMELSWK